MKPDVIEIQGLTKTFRGQTVLQDLDLVVKKGELVAVIGRSGAGKSVLIRHLIGLMLPDSGSIRIEGIDLTAAHGKAIEEVRKKFGVVFQEGALFDSMTVSGNIEFPLRERSRLVKREIRERVDQALEDVGLRGMGDKYPAEISGGMKRRTALARALITEPSIVLFDEPTTGLDPVILNAIHTLIRNTHEKYGFTGVLISHEIPEVFTVADRIAMLYNGRIVQEGTPEEIRSSENPYVAQFISGSLEGPIELLS